MKKEPVRDSGPLEQASDLAACEGGDINPTEQKRLLGAMRYLEQIRDQMSLVESAATPQNFNSSTLFEGQINLEPGNQDRDELPKHFGRFEIKRILGQGGFARVFLAVDPRLDRDVALKIPIAEILSSREAKARFRREAKAAAVLNHPNIVPVFEADHIGPIEYIATAFVDGPSLKTWLNFREGPIDTGQAAQFVCVLADALEHAHQRGVIHRDLKPANILIDLQDHDCQTDHSIDAAKLKISDFGLAKLETVDQFKTTEGAIIGTPVYMSPEQARGSKNVALPSDIYSLGVILYQLLTGRVPFESDSYLNVLQAVQTQLPIAPRKTNPRVDNDLETICLKCLEKNPTDRYQSAFELHEDLYRWLNGQAIQAKKASPWRQVRLWSRRNRSLSTALAALLVTLTVGLSVTTWKWIESDNNLNRAVAEESRSRKNFAIAQHVVDDLVKSIVTDVNANDQTRLQAAQKLVDLQNRLLESEPTNKKSIAAAGEAYFQLATIKKEQAKYEDSLEALAQAAKIAVRLNSGEEKNTLLHRIEVESKRVRSLNGENIGELKTGTKPKSERNQALSEAQIFDAEGLSLMRSNKYGLANKQFNNGLTALESLDPTKDPFVADMYLRLNQGACLSLANSGQLESAESHLEKAFLGHETLTNFMGESHPVIDEHHAQLNKSLGILRKLQLRPNEAIDAFRTSQKLQSKFLERNRKTKRFASQFFYVTEEIIGLLEEVGDQGAILIELQKVIEVYAEIDPDLQKRQSFSETVTESFIRLTNMPLELRIEKSKIMLIIETSKIATGYLQEYDAERAGAALQEIGRFEISQMSQ